MVNRRGHKIPTGLVGARVPKKVRRAALRREQATARWNADKRKKEEALKQNGVSTSEPKISPRYDAVLRYDDVGSNRHWCVYVGNLDSSQVALPGQLRFNGNRNGISWHQEKPGVIQNSEAPHTYIPVQYFTADPSGIETLMRDVVGDNVPVHRIEGKFDPIELTLDLRKLNGNLGQQGFRDIQGYLE
jgi:hypothetical protein